MLSSAVVTTTGADALPSPSAVSVAVAPRTVKSAADAEFVAPTPRNQLTGYALPGSPPVRSIVKVPLAPSVMGPAGAAMVSAGLGFGSLSWIDPCALAL